LPDQRVGGCQNAQYYHEKCEEEACNAKTTMDIHTAGGDQ